MNAPSEPINPHEVAKPATTLLVNNIIFLFGTGEQYATASASFLDEDGKVVQTIPVPLTEQELSTWGADDAELAIIVKTKLGL